MNIKYYKFFYLIYDIKKTQGLQQPCVLLYIFRSRTVKFFYSKNNFISSSTVPIGAIPKFSTSTPATAGDKNPGRVGPR